MIDRPEVVYEVRQPEPVFTLAVTGHRDLGAGCSEAELGRHVGSLLDKLAGVADACAPSQPRLRVLSALAAGADQLAADVATQPGRGRADGGRWELHAVLPFPLDDYRKSLDAALEPRRPQAGPEHCAAPAAATSQERFDRLHGLAHRTLELADWTPESATMHRDRQAYWSNLRLRTLGELLVGQADVLLAIWRGTPPGGEGGTADVVRIALQRRVPVIRIDPESCRLSLLLPQAALDDPVKLATRTEASTTVAAMREALAPYCRGVLNHPGLDPAPQEGDRQGTSRPAPDSLAAFLGRGPGPRGGEQAASTSGWTLYDRFASLFGAGGRSGVWRALLPQRLRVDHMAAELASAGEGRAAHTPAVDDVLRDAMLSSDAIATARSHVYRSGYVMTFLGSVFAVWLGLLGLFSKQKWIFVSAELVVLAALLALYRISRTRAWHRRWINARHVAESLRGSRLLAWLGLAGRRAGEDDAPWSMWLGNAIVAQTGVPTARLTPQELCAVAREMRIQLDGQEQYHHRNGERLERLHHRLDVVGWACLSLAIVAGLVYVAYFDPARCFGAGWCTPDTITLSKYGVTALAAGLPLLAAALAGIRYQGDFERFSKRSERTRRALGRIRRRLDAFIDESAQCGTPRPADSPPLFEELADIAMDLCGVYEADLEDWRYEYAARPSPGLG